MHTHRTYSIPPVGENVGLGDLIRTQARFTSDTSMIAGIWSGLGSLRFELLDLHTIIFQDEDTEFCLDTAAEQQLKCKYVVLQAAWMLAGR